MNDRLPIIFVRGFAGDQGAIDAAVYDAFYGLNEGSTRIRVGAGGQPRFYQFEGLLLRLISGQGYHVRVAGSQQQVLLSAGPAELPPDSVWIYLFYDEESGSFGNEPKPYDNVTPAQGLAAFISLVRSKAQGTPRVNQMAHSMGGLTCRTALQRLMPDPEESVSELCTVGTPNGGIDPQLGGGMGGWLMEEFGPDGSNIFSPDHMHEYMLPAGAPGDAGVDPCNGQWDPRRMVGPFSAGRVLSIVGTDSADYAVANGLSTVVMGVQSDGLVAIRNAYVVGSTRAYVHRSHSGRYGLVNSEEAYQNLKCFFFGGLRLEVGLRGLIPAELEDCVWQTDVRLAVRGIPVLLHEQTAAHYCPVDINAQAKQLSTPDSPVPLVTLFLEPEAANSCRYALDISVTSLDETGGILGFGDHLEQVGDWEDTLDSGCWAAGQHRTAGGEMAVEQRTLRPDSRPGTALQRGGMGCGRRRQRQRALGPAHRSGQEALERCCLLDAYCDPLDLRKTKGTFREKVSARRWCRSAQFCNPRHGDRMHR